MDYKNAQQKLSELRDSLNEVLGSKTQGPSRKDAEEALKTAKDGARQAKKTLIGKIKEFPVIDKITQLGTAGTVAVSTAAVTQTNIAVDQTEVFVASVANDVVHERLRFPPLIDNFIDFNALDTWGSQVMKEKIAKVKAEVAKTESKVTSVETKTESQSTEEPQSQEPQAQEESANNGNEDGRSTKEAKQSKESINNEEIKSEDTSESKEEQLAESMPEESIEEATEEVIDEIDEIKPHSDFNPDESEELLIMPNDGITVSPEGPRQV